MPHLRLQARKLKEIIHEVRRNYERDWDSKEHTKRQVRARGGAHT